MQRRRGGCSTRRLPAARAFSGSVWPAPAACWRSAPKSAPRRRYQKGSAQRRRQRRRPRRPQNHLPRCRQNRRRRHQHRCRQHSKCSCPAISLRDGRCRLTFRWASPVIALVAAEHLPADHQAVASACIPFQPPLVLRQHQGAVNVDSGRCCTVYWGACCTCCCMHTAHPSAVAGCCRCWLDAQ